jgi:hypothetical protein
MDDLDRVFHRLVSNIRHRHPEYLTLPFTVQELYETLIPYRHHRRELGIETNQDYEIAVTRLLSGERDYLMADPECATSSRRSWRLLTSTPVRSVNSRARKFRSRLKHCVALELSLFRLPILRPGRRQAYRQRPRHWSHDPQRLGGRRHSAHPGPLRPAQQSLGRQQLEESARLSRFRPRRPRRRLRPRRPRPSSTRAHRRPARSRRLATCRCPKAVRSAEEHFPRDAP